MSIPSNKFQRKINQLKANAIRPAIGLKSQAACLILKVWDPDYLAVNVPGEELAKKLASFPNVLYAEVQLINGKVITAAFDESEDQIFATYGNSVQLVGRPAILHYANNDVNNGRITVSKNHTKPNLSLTKVATTYDIGGVV